MVYLGSFCQYSQEGMKLKAPREVSGPSTTAISTLVVSTVALRVATAWLWLRPTRLLPFTPIRMSPFWNTITRHHSRTSSESSIVMLLSFHVCSKLNWMFHINNMKQCSRSMFLFWKLKQFVSQDYLRTMYFPILCLIWYIILETSIPCSWRSFISKENYSKLSRNKILGALPSFICISKKVLCNQFVNFLDSLIHKTNLHL